MGGAVGPLAPPKAPLRRVGGAVQGAVGGSLMPSKRMRMNQATHTSTSAYSNMVEGENWRENTSAVSQIVYSKRAHAAHAAGIHCVRLVVYPPALQYFPLTSLQLQPPAR